MGLLDSSMRAVASSLIGSLGTALVTFTRIDRVVDVEADTEVDTTTTEDFKMSPPMPYEDHRVNGTTILSEDMLAMIAASDVSATTFDIWPGATATITVVFDGDTYTVVSVQPIYSGDQVAAYELQLRR